MRCVQLQQLVSLLVAVVVLHAAAQTTSTCPGLQQGPNGPECGRECQLAICDALANFYQYSQPSRAGRTSWNATDGWETALERSCAAWVDAYTGPGAAYCGERLSRAAPLQRPRFPQLECCNGTRYLLEEGEVTCMFPYAPANLTMKSNRVNGSLTPFPRDPTGMFGRSITTLMNCGLMVLDLTSNDIGGSMTEVWGTYTSLRHLVLASNWIAGTLPANISQLQDLTVLRLDSNMMVGAIPPQWTSMRSLRRLTLGAQVGGGHIGGLNGTLPEGILNLPQLVELNLQLNRLTGQLPTNMCAPGSNLTVLSVKNNMLTGPVRTVRNCTKLMLLDLSGNTFTGALPANYAWSNLVIYSLGYNNFTGTLPAQLYRLPFLTILDVRNNTLSGTIDRNVEQMSYLQSLLLSNNFFVGTIPETLWYLASLTRLLLENNQLSGTLADTVQYTSSLNQLRLNNNPKLAGSLPDSIGQLRFLERFEMLDTSMSAAPPNYSLPCFLEQNPSVMVAPPLTSQDKVNSTALVCPQIQRVVAGPNGVDWTCGFSHADPDAGPRDDNSLQYWVFDPLYYNYSNCSCLAGFTIMWQLDNSTGRSRAKCVQVVTDTVQAFPVYISAIVAACAVVGIIGFGLFIILTFKRLAHKPSWLWRKEIAKHRIKGPPQEGLMSVVVTDIEGYSDMMKASPHLMTKALGLHNHAIRKACHANAGHVLEQEGDSYSIAFHRPLEAVAFCLQVQLALHRTDWPSGLLGIHASDKRGVSTVGLSSKEPSVTAGNSATVPGAPSLHGPSLDSVGSLKMAKRRSKRGARLLTSFMRGATMADDTGGSRFWSLFMEKGADEEGLFNGLRVRMGVASGDKPKDRDIKATLVWEQAKVISDIGNGGQILLDETTFDQIKRNLFELGTVDHNGIDFKKLLTMREMLGVCPRPEADDLSMREAVVLDMGQYEYAAMATAAAAAVAAAAAGTGLQPTANRNSSWADGEEPTLEHLHRLRTLSIAHMREEPSGKRSRMRLYQVLSPELVSRAHRFVNKLALPKTGSTCTDLPYFDAPGALHADLSASISLGRPEREISNPLLTLAPANGPDLPAITMVFCIVEGSKVFVKRYRKEAEHVHSMIHATLMLALRTTTGGYLCRVQEGEFKYMVAFYDPSDALGWCLLVQELLMWQPWPDVVLHHPGMGEVRDASGNVVFRGPRLKMGVCEGAPRTIMPDHLGRADYHGSSINQAARYMDAAAHGGMVVCEARLAGQVFAMWRDDRLPPLVEVPDNCMFAANARDLQQGEGHWQRLLYSHEDLLEAKREAELDRQAALLEDGGRHSNSNGGDGVLEVVVPRVEGGGVVAQSTPSASMQEVSLCLPTTSTSAAAAAATSTVSVHAAGASDDTQGVLPAATIAAAASQAGGTRRHSTSAFLHAQLLPGSAVAGDTGGSTATLSSGSVTFPYLQEQEEQASPVAPGCEPQLEHGPLFQSAPSAAGGGGGASSQEVPYSQAWQSSVAAPAAAETAEDHTAGVYSAPNSPQTGRRQSSRLSRMLSATDNAAAEAAPAAAAGAEACHPPSEVSSDTAAPLAAEALLPGLPSRRHTVSNSSRKWMDAAGGAGSGNGVPLGRGNHVPAGRRSLDETRSVTSSSVSELDQLHAAGSGYGSGSGQQPAAPLRPKTPFEVLTQPPPPPPMAGGGTPSCSTTSTGGALPTVSSTDHPLQQRLAAVGLHIPLFDSSSGPRPANSGSTSVSNGFWLFGNRKTSQNQIQASQDSASSTQSPGAELAQREASLLAGQATTTAAAGSAEKPLPPPPEPSVGVRSRMLQSSIKDYALPCGYVPAVVLARGVGVWKFKGNPAPLDMVQVHAVTLQGRSYPSEPPKGKGNRVSVQGDGAVVQDAVLQLPDTALVAHERLLVSQAQQTTQLLLGARGSSFSGGGGNPMSRMRQMGHAALALTSMRKPDSDRRRGSNSYTGSGGGNRSPSPGSAGGGVMGLMGRASAGGVRRMSGAPPRPPTPTTSGLGSPTAVPGTSNMV